MSRFAMVLLVLWVLAGVGLYEAYAPSSYVWNGNAEALRRVVPPLRTLRAANLLLWLSAGVSGYWLLSRTTGKRQVLAGALLLGGWVVADRGLGHYLATEQYTAWKYQQTNEETEAAGFPALTAQVMAMVLRDLQSPAESLYFRVALATYLGNAQIQESYSALQAVAEDPRQDPMLQLHYLKALRVLRPQQFAARLSAAPDSARALYQRFEPDKL